MQIIKSNIPRATVLVTIPKKVGDPTYWTSEWGHKMEYMSRSMGYNTIVLKGDNVNYRNLTTALEKYHPRLYIHTGHGCPASLTGQNECILTRKFSIDELMEMGRENPEKLDKLLNPVKLSGCGQKICQLESNQCNPLCLRDTNIHLLKDSIVYAVSCHSAERLGKCAIQYGVQSYIGYRDLLLFPVDSMRSQDIFGEVHLKLLNYLLYGYSVGEANMATNNVEDTYIRLYKRIRWTGLPLLWNHLHRDILGDKNARIYE